VRKNIAILIVLVVFAGVYFGTTKHVEAKKEKRFERNFQQTFDASGQLYIISDKKTGVEYMLYSRGIALAVCKLEK